MSEDEEDEANPFESLAESTEDREGDPFEHLDGPAEEDRTETEGGPVADESTPGNPEPATGDVGSEPGTAAGADDVTTGYEPPGPGSGPGPDVGKSDGSEGSEIPDPDAPDAGRGDDPFESADSVFERMDAGDLDADAVWEEIADAESRGSVSEVRERTYADVSKHSYCEQCEHFSEPPGAACTHEGTDILEFLDMEHVRVVDCPVVAERRQIERDE